MSQATAQCRSCKAPIFFARSRVTARLNPINELPDSNGNIALEGTADGYPWADVLTGWLLDQAHDEGQVLFLSHFATCPNSKNHRKDTAA